ncbi:MAG: 3,4-dihydroxy-2-butanone-4-phosphate synthase [Hyphomicrobiales bacterium]|nr:MAG: 3,4-dihydroxy-2-butanone-4-phosphate synthase [Hyphomicrobiales bacterium]
MNDENLRMRQAIEAFKSGEMLVVTDDDDRENEGDLIVAAVHATPEKMAFMIRYTSGIVCAPLSKEEAVRLHLNPMVANNDAPHSTAFTVSVDYRHDTTTGISAAERCSTVRALANPNAGAADFVRPGHIFPLVAREGGVLTRSGHTEAAVDLCQLADLPAVGVISELVNDDGTVKRGPDVIAFAKEHGLRQVSVAELIAYRQRRETLVERVGERTMDTRFGKALAISYRTPFDPMQHLALVYGNIHDGAPVPVRLQLENVLGDVFGTDQSLENSMAAIVREGRGVVVYLREGAVGVSADSDRATRGPTMASTETEQHASTKTREEDWREIGLGAQILRDLDVSSIRLLASKKRHYVGLDGFGISIVETDLLDS